jgi:acetolactate synthase-1/2/3 large subunit
MKLSDYVVSFLENLRVKNIFILAGGGAMHLVDSVGRSKSIRYICNHHEQAATIAAEAYARLTNNIGVALVTTGPGGTNTITGVIGAWLDSIPILVISGQVKIETTIINNTKLRQLGDQEINIIDIIRPITKYAVMVTNKNEIKYHLQKAIYLAKSGRPGPVWVDIPLDIQGAHIEKNSLKEYDYTNDVKKDLDSKINTVMNLLKKSERPVIIAGNGIRLSKAVEEFRILMEKLKIPVIATFVGYDIVPSTNPYYFGRYGSMGQRAGNFTVQNSDLVLAIGSRLNIRAISYNYKAFAREAMKIVVDIDPAELEKPTLKIDVPIWQDAKRFIVDLLKGIENHNIGYKDNWLKKCLEYKTKYPNITPEREDVKKFVDSYYFFKKLSNLTKDGTIFAFGNGTACVSSYQSFDVKPNQRVIVNSGCASMGYGLPAAIGACFGNNKKSVICVTGDGSIQLNIQELQTIVHYKLPIKIFVLNNQGYISIRNTQNNFFNGFFVGSNKESGVSCPDMIKIAKAYGISTLTIKNHEELEYKIKKALSYPEAILCDVNINPEEKMYPKLSSEKKEDGTIVSKPLEDMYPFLDRDEFKRNMIIKPLLEE